MFCPECGFRNADGAGFCVRCGARLMGESPDAQTTISYLPDEDEREAPAAAVLAGETAALVVRSGGGLAGETIALSGDRVTIGRHPAADVFLDDVTVSRNHAVITRSGDSWEIADEGSLNGTYVNRKRSERVRLADGDEVQVGKYKLTFLSPSQGS